MICFDCGEVGNFVANCLNRSDGNSKGKKGFKKFNKVKRKDSKGTFSLKKIAHHQMKTMTVKKKPMREYCLWPSTINKRYQTTKKKEGP